MKNTNRIPLCIMLIHTIRVMRGMQIVFWEKRNISYPAQYAHSMYVGDGHCIKQQYLIFYTNSRFSTMSRLLTSIVSIGSELCSSPIY